MEQQYFCRLCKDKISYNQVCLNNALCDEHLDAKEGYYRVTYRDCEDIHIGYWDGVYMYFPINSILPKDTIVHYGEINTKGKKYDYDN